MHHQIIGIALCIGVALLSLIGGYLIVMPMIECTPPGKVRLLVECWLAICLLIPAASAPVSSYLSDQNIGYLSELGKFWPIYTMYMSGFVFFLVRRRQAR